MTLDGKLVFVGAGNMAGALIEGLLDAQVCRAKQITASDIDASRLASLADAHGVRTASDNQTAVAGADLVVLSTKPQVFPKLLPQIAPSLERKTLVVSIAAGIPLAVMQSHLPAGTRVVRSMPNTPALVRTGATAIAPGEHATGADLAACRELFSSVGMTVSVDEPLLDAVTGLSGSGPAYVLLIIEALSDAGVHMGLTREHARRLAAQTVLGAAKLLIDSGEHPAQLRDRVSSPAGTTIAGLAALESAGIRAALFDAVREATERSRALGAEAATRLAKKA